MVNGTIGHTNLPRKAENQEEEEDGDTTMMIMMKYHCLDANGQSSRICW